MRCLASGRHWFTVRGAVGVKRPDCLRCGAPRPKPLTAEEQETFDYWVAQGWTE